MNTSTISPPVSRPKLRHGERLDREEFRRRYEAMPDIKAELLDGVAYIMSSPVSEYHGNPHADLVTWLGVYRAYTPGIINGDNTTVHLPLDNDPQPDAYLRIAPTHGGKTQLDEKGYIVGSPDFIGEVSYSSVSYDRSIKLPIYQREGVREFLLWRVGSRVIDWYARREGKFELLAADELGIVRSEVFPGLWLHPGAMVRGNMSDVLAMVQQGIASPGHGAFVDRLRQMAERK